MTNKLLLRIANAAFFILVVLINILANVLPIGDFSTGQISAMYPTLITPPGWTFSIWAVIYALLAVIVFRQLFISRYSDSFPTGLYFIISCILNIAWIFAWHSQRMLIAAIAIVALFAVLLKLYIMTQNSDFLTKTAFSIYYAWITVASLIMIFAAVKTMTGNAPVTPIEPRSSVNNSAAGILGEFTGIILISGTPEIVSYVTVFEYIMAIVSMILITIITAAHIRIFNDYAYVAAVIWALGGIFIRQFTAVTPPVLFLIVCAASMAVIAYFMIKTQFDMQNVRKETYETNYKSQNL